MTRWLWSERGVVAIVRALLVSIAFVVLAMPLWRELGLDDSIRAAFAPYCHQRLDRSFALGGVALPVCARCLGLWLGAAIAVVALPWLRSARVLPPIGVLAAAAAPMLLDVALEHLAGTPPRPFARLLTGLVLGAAIAAFVLPALVRAGEEIRRCGTRTSTSPVS